MALEKITTCPICKSTQFANHLSAKDYTTTQEEFTIVKCTNCDLAITNPRPTSDSIGGYYESDKYISHTGGKTTLADWMYRQARRYMLNRKKTIIEKYQPKGNVLDYGCGTGEFLEHMISNGWNVSGVEPSSQARTKAQINVGLTISSSIDEVQTETNNVITLWHVAEHILELNETITKIKGKLSEGGYLFVAVPNYESPDAKKYQHFWAAYDVPRHVWHFSKKSMQELVKNHGMKIVEIQPMILDAFYISMISEQYRQPGLFKLTALIKGAFQGWLSNYRAKTSTNYSSLLYIIQK